MNHNPTIPSSPFLSAESFLTLWRRERAYRVGKTICWVGLPLSLAATVVDFIYSSWQVWGGDLLIFLCCFFSLMISRKDEKKENPKFLWWPPYASYWLSSFGTFWVTGGINSPFLSLVLIVLYICGVIVQTEIRQTFVFLFIISNILFWAVLEYFRPLSAVALQLQPVFTASILCLGLSVLVACIAEMLRTESKMSQEILGRYTELLEAKQKLEREEIANVTKTTFLANVSHELRTPLGAILGYTELLSDPESTEEERTLFLETIRRNGFQLSRLVDDLLDLSKVEVGKLEIEKIEFSLTQVLSEVLELLQISAQKKNLYLKVNFLNPIPEKLFSDPLRIKQILMNVVGNALKFTDAGGVTLEVQCDYFSLSNQGEMSISISDTGRGLSEEEKQKLFKPFSQADASMARQFGGTGLGLNLSRKLAELLGGNLVLASSEIQKGSTFNFSFRFEAHSQNMFFDKFESRIVESYQALQSQKKSEAALKDQRILVVDDMADNQHLLRAYLQVTGAQLDSAFNGLEAIEKVKANTYHVILMDIQMPLMDGLQATRKIREMGFQGLIVALTAHALKEDREHCLRAGCDDYMTKPVERNLLLDRIKKRFEN